MPSADLRNPSAVFNPSRRSRARSCNTTNSLTDKDLPNSSSARICSVSSRRSFSQWRGSSQCASGFGFRVKQFLAPWLTDIPFETMNREVSVWQGFTSKVKQVIVMGKEDDLAFGGQFVQDAEGGAGTVVVELDQDVIDD